MGIVDFVRNILNFVNTSLIPFIIALAFLFFVWNAARYFIIQGADPIAREKAKQLALWGILAFVFILSTWGIVNLLTGSLRLSNNGTPITPDYIQGGGYPGGTGGGSGGALTCTTILGPLEWCGTSSSQSTYTPGSPGPTTNPNPSPTTITFPI